MVGGIEGFFQVDEKGMGRQIVRAAKLEGGAEGVKAILASTSGLGAELRFILWLELGLLFIIYTCIYTII